MPSTVSVHGRAPQFMPRSLCGADLLSPGAGPFALVWQWKRAWLSFGAEGW